MKFGIFDHMDRSGPDAGRQYEERLKLIQLYEWAGFHSYHVAEHHSTRHCHVGACEPFLASARAC